jgi:hypothetical protein
MQIGLHFVGRLPRGVFQKKTIVPTCEKFVAASATAALFQAEVLPAQSRTHGVPIWQSRITVPEPSRNAVTSYLPVRVSQNVTAYYHLPSRLRHTTHRLDWEIGVT